jgi:hypothetical protein
LTEEEIARQEAIYRGRELVDEWQALKLLGEAAEQYC